MDVIGLVFFNRGWFVVKLNGTCNGGFESFHGGLQGFHGVLQSYKGVFQSHNGVLQSCNGLLQSCNHVLQSYIMVCCSAVMGAVMGIVELKDDTHKDRCMQGKRHRDRWIVWHMDICILSGIRIDSYCPPLICLELVAEF